MEPTPAWVLAINGGSSSIKFAVCRIGTLPTLSLSGTLDRIGRDGTTLSWRATESASREGHTQVPDNNAGDQELEMESGHSRPDRTTTVIRLAATCAAVMNAPRSAPRIAHVGRRAPPHPCADPLE